jgi:hypothetical protein
MVMRGWRPGYSILSWLPVYSFALGLLTLIPAYLLWVGNRYALTVSIVTFGVHTIVLLLLLTAFRGQVAAQSIGAMTFRMIVWIIILACCGSADKAERRSPLTFVYESVTRLRGIFSTAEGTPTFNGLFLVNGNNNADIAKLGSEFSAALPIIPRANSSKTKRQPCIQIYSSSPKSTGVNPTPS